MSFKFAVAATLISAAVAGNVQNSSYYEAKFYSWLSEHKVQPKDGNDFVRMLQNFANNDDIITAHNAQKHSYTLGHNQFSHMSNDEFKAFVQSSLRRPVQEEQALYTHNAPSSLSGLATSVDWRSNGAVTPVKDQGSCGSCWSFSTTGALEGAYKNKYGTLKSFSEQNLVDCDNFRHGGRDLGCNGGLMDSAFSWIKKNGGLSSEADYPYVSGTTKTAGDCTQSSSKLDANVAPKSYVDVATNSESALVSALNIGPVSIAIQADQAAFQLYKSGVFTADCGTNLDHGVLAVGYTADAWIVKNSWGSGWGDAGYIYLARGVSQKEGQCGLLSGPPSYPVL